jgi:hypothetical protein
MSEVKVNKISPRSGTTVTLGDSGDTITIPSGVTFDASSGGLAGTLTTAAQPNITSVGTLTSFSSTGIDDNATSTAITIDSSENVGIGTTSPASLGSNITTVEITGGSTIRQGGVYLSNSDKSVKSYIYGSNTATNIGTETNIPLVLLTNNSERMRIDSSGRVLIGTTNVDVYGSSTESGQVFGTTGSLQLSNDDTGSAGNAALYINQVNTPASNTKSVRFLYEGTEVGSIITSTTGIGIRLGGTGTANTLDDYEEGTWTPTYVPDSGSFTSVTYASTAGEYTKIGNTVYFTFYIQTNAITVGSASGYVKIGGLPFAPGGGATSNGGGTVINASFFAGDKPFYGTVGGSSEIFLYYSTGSTANDSLLDVSDLGTGGTDNVFQMMGTYITTA